MKAQHSTTRCIAVALLTILPSLSANAGFKDDRVSRSTSANGPVELKESAGYARARFTLQKDQPIHEALKSWCEKEGWDLTWYPFKSWKVFRDYQMTEATDVVDAVSSVVSILREEGKPIRLKISEGNRVMEVYSTEIRHD